MGLLLFLELLEELVHLVEARLPELAVAFHPLGELAQRLRAQLVQALLRARLHLDQPHLLEYPQVLGDLRLGQPQPLAAVVPRGAPAAQQLDDPEAVGLAQRREGLEHGMNMPAPEYSCNGIFRIPAAP